MLSCEGHEGIQETGWREGHSALGNGIKHRPEGERLMNGSLWVEQNSAEEEQEDGREAQA